MKGSRTPNTSTSLEAGGWPLAFRDVYENHWGLVWRVCRRMGVPRADIQDACQEVFVIVHRKLNEVERRSSLRPWLFGICMRVAAAHRRQTRLAREIAVDRVPDVPQPEAVSERVERNEARAMLEEILGELDDSKRAVFVLYELEGVSMSEIAESLGCPVQTAYWRLHAARQQVQEGIARRAIREAAS